MSGPALSETEAGYPVKANPEILMGTFRDTIVKTDDQWLISTRVGSIEMMYG